jgi:hypothetical protein
MRSLKTSLLAVLFAIPAVSAHAYLETFETQTNNVHQFTSNGTVFTTGSKFLVQGGYPGTGWNGTADDNKYLDNSGSVVTGTGVDLPVASIDTSPFSVQSVWLYLAGPNLDLTATGSVTIYGKLGGNIVFTAGPVTSGFNQNMNVDNGFSFIDLRTFGGSDNSNKAIDEFEVVTTANYIYLSFDAWTWSHVTDRVFQDNFEQFISD